jgi:phenylpyruvate tautomerase PptA (4-oxalocrotonate tautomerase family)
VVVATDKFARRSGHFVVGSGESEPDRGRIQHMPSALIEVRRQYTEQEEVALIDAVHGALITAFQIPPQDKDVRLVVHAPHRFACSPRLTQPEFFTLVTIDCFAGRSLDAKRTLYREIVTNLKAFNIPPDHVTILVRDHPTHNWGIRAGQAASDLDLGFNINV